MAETPMSNGLRRLLAHLATPYTLLHLSYRLLQDPHVGVSTEELQAALEEAIERGWVVNLGTHAEPAGVVEAISSEGDAVGFGKGQAKIWQARAEAGYANMEGDFYMLSQDGLEALRGDDEDEPVSEQRQAVPADLGDVPVLTAGNGKGANK